jgi:YfiH family protein
MRLLYEKKLSHGWFRAFDQKPEGPFAHVHQTHSVTVLAASTPDLSAQEADGIVSSGGEGLAIKTADCLPVAIEGSFGVALLHAGWRGLAGGILTDKEVQKLQPREAFIGPCIRACCFEVTGEFAANFPHTPVTRRSDGSLRFDLVAEAHRQLKAQFTGIQVSDSGVCTSCDRNYPSYRRDKTPQRIWNLYVPLAQ